MAKQAAYLVIDIGTGNVRVAVATPEGALLAVERADVIYHKDELYPEALYFEPGVLWQQIVQLSRTALAACGDAAIQAVTASSQREGIVLTGENGKLLIGLPNHDHRGREWEGQVNGKDHIYELTGRYPSSLFSALKLVGIRERRPELFSACRSVMSISDWAQYMLCGIAGYEHAQASETQLYDIAGKCWSEELCAAFGVPQHMLPELQQSGTIQGRVLPHIAAQFGIPDSASVVVGGADTQLAMQSTRPGTGDIVIVSGTTTPIVRITDSYVVDSQQRTWSGRHTEENKFVLEANAGVTGLNYQRLKEIFYPNEDYDVIEAELSRTEPAQCVASLGSLIAEEHAPLTRGGFLFSTPVSHELTRANFVRATLWDIACCIKENFDCLLDVAPYEQDYIWACGGGFQSTLMRQFVADMTGRTVRIRQNYRQASVAGGVVNCNLALGRDSEVGGGAESVQPRGDAQVRAYYEQWKATREDLKSLYVKPGHSTWQPA
ncbi:sugar kinase [Pedobacter yulinensis]|uniref:Sugar kinase n=1 Tax=Pedobacter yulinensis TaxID=2126353 RepID=A0A2T3HQI6_9SPHI|nr:FGGY family carbohydrate kinase [Pedobacter yulinensis]PST84661.1 sugar kinase [Pedobacter yulinensis]